jgi:hypothetical protein
LGNFPARDLFDSVRPTAGDQLPPYLALEAVAREIETDYREASECHDGTPFQLRLWLMLQTMKLAIPPQRITV